jgi:sulfate/thiosulfate transport system permease protein
VLRLVPGPSVAAIYLSLLVLIPLAAVFAQAFTGGPRQLWAEMTQPETFAALRLSLIVSLIVVVANAFTGTAIAWLLVRDRFVLNRVVGSIVDLPFSLPTVIAGVTLISLYGPGSPLHVNIAFTRYAILVALAFVTLPFAVRSVQPVLEELDKETEEAAASLGASPWTTFRRITLPALMPALLTGAGLGFARAIGEYGSVTILSGNLPFKTEVASVRIFALVGNSDLPSAAAAALALFLISIVVLSLTTIARRRFLPKDAAL